MPVANRRRRAQPTLRELLGEDTSVIVLEELWPQGSRRIQRGERLKLSDPLVRQFPAHFAVVIPIAALDGEIER